MAKNQFKGSTFNEDSETIDNKSQGFGTDRDFETEWDSADGFQKITQGGVSGRADAPDDFSLKGYWPLAGHAKDLSLYGNDGTLTAGAGGYSDDSLAGPQAIDFDGVDTFVLCGSDPSIDDLTKKTIRFWVKPRTAGETGFARIIEKTNGAKGWLVFTQATEELVFRQYFDGAGDGVWSTDSNALVYGVWSFVVITYDLSSVANNPLIYINGVSVTVNEDTTPVGTADSDAAGSLVIGNKADQSATFDGLIAEVMLYDRILPEREGLKLYKASSESPTFQNVTVAGNLVVTGSTVNTPATITTDTTPTAAGRKVIIIGAWTAANDITDFDNETAGQELTIIGGDADCNVVDGAPIQLVGGTTWNGIAGATLVLISDGTIWYEKSRSAT